MTPAQAIFEECWPRWQRHFPPDTRLRLGRARLADLPACAADMQNFLSADELTQYIGFSQGKRRTEWLGGRLTAKWAAERFLAQSAMDWRTLVIKTEKDGRPYIAPEVRAIPPFISISHSGHMAAALAANLPCGLDIQQPSEKILRVKECFVNPEEAKVLTASLPGSFTETHRLTVLWAAKEAVRKAVRASPLLGLLEIRLLAGHGASTPQEPLALTFTSGREPCPANITALCFLADNLAWAMACPLMITKE